MKPINNRKLIISRLQNRSKRSLTLFFLVIVGGISIVAVILGAAGILNLDNITAFIGLIGTALAGASGLAQSSKAEEAEDRQLRKNVDRLSNPEHYSNLEETRGIVISKSREQAKKAIVTRRLLIREINMAIFATSIAFSLAALYTIIGKLINYPVAISYFVIWLVVMSLSILVWLRIYLLSYRIKNRYYGNNQYEARFLIRFINDELDKSPPSDSGGIGQAFSEPEESEGYGWLTDAGQAGELT